MEHLVAEGTGSRGREAEAGSCLTAVSRFATPTEKRSPKPYASIHLKTLMYF